MDASVLVSEINTLICETRKFILITNVHMMRVENFFRHYNAFENIPIHVINIRVNFFVSLSLSRSIHLMLVLRSKLSRFIHYVNGRFFVYFCSFARIKIEHRCFMNTLVRATYDVRRTQERRCATARMCSFYL